MNYQDCLELALNETVTLSCNAPTNQKQRTASRVFWCSGVHSTTAIHPPYRALGLNVQLLAEAVQKYRALGA